MTRPSPKHNNASMAATVTTETRTVSPLVRVECREQKAQEIHNKPKTQRRKNTKNKNNNNNNNN